MGVAGRAVVIDLLLRSRGRGTRPRPWSVHEGLLERGLPGGELQQRDAGGPATRPTSSVLSPDTARAPSSAPGDGRVPGAEQGRQGVRVGAAHPHRAGRGTGDESSVPVSAISRPRPMTIRCWAVRAISLIRCEETKTVRPSAASPRSSDRIQRIPSVSRPFTGSSRITVRGSPSSAAAMPSRWPMPSEKPPARRATPPSPTASTTSSTRDRRMPQVWASASRWW